jgi:hypothetical protein
MFQWKSKRTIQWELESYENKVGINERCHLQDLTYLGSLHITIVGHTVVGHIGAGDVAVSDKYAALWIIHTEDSRWLGGAFHHFPISLRTE